LEHLNALVEGFEFFAEDLFLVLGFLEFLLFDEVFCVG